MHNKQGLGGWDSGVCQAPAGACLSMGRGRKGSKGGSVRRQKCLTLPKPVRRVGPSGTRRDNSQKAHLGRHFKDASSEWKRLLTIEKLDRKLQRGNLETRLFKS